MRIVMMGTGPYAVPTLISLYESAHEVAGLITRPDCGGPGGREMSINPLRHLAVAEGTPIFDPEDVNSNAAQIALNHFSPDLLIVCDYGQILTPETLNIAKQGAFNLHASLLPNYRGAAPIQWAIYHGETQTGNTVIHMNSKLDAGPIVARQVVCIEPEETAFELEKRLAVLGAGLVQDVIAAVEKGTLTPLPQDQTGITQAPKLTKSLGDIDWTRSAEAICNQVRALVPWPKTHTHWLRDAADPLRVIIEKVGAEPGTGRVRPGEVIEAEEERLLVATGDGSLCVERLQPAGKKSLLASAFLRGYRMSVGDCFGTPKRMDG